jgi:3-hydroxyisobutyrate dehydrogenase
MNELKKQGARQAASGTALAVACEVIFLNQPTASEMREVIFGVGGLLEGLSPGKILVDQSDGDPDATRALARELAVKSVTLIDAPVSGHYRDDTPSPETVMVSGPADVCEKLRPVLEGICSKVFYCGGVGNAQVVHLVNNAMSAATQIATLEVMAMGKKFGLSLETMAKVVNLGSGRNRTSEIMAPRLAAGQKTSDCPLPRMANLMNLFVQLGTRRGASMIATNVGRGLLQASAHRFGEDGDMDDTARLVESMANTNLHH